jgi:hypothetical protein
MQNTYIPKFTYVIPFRFSQTRIIGLRRIIDWLSGFQGAEVLVIEQDTHSKISHLNLRATHVFLESDAPFNKSWAFNVAIRRCISPVMIFGDADTFMNPMDLIESLKTLDTHDCVLPLGKIIQLNPQESLQDLNMIFTIDRPEFSLGRNITDGISIFKKDAIQKIGGWNEDFLGVGYENRFQDVKIKKMLNYKTLDYKGYHLFHPTQMVDPNLDQRNKQIFDHYKEADVNMLQQHISTTVPKSGQSNKFQ